MDKTYTTTLETLQHDVKAVLNDKLKATSPQQTADYIAFACDNLEANIQRAKEAKKELDDYIKQNTSAIETIKEQTAEWLSESGIDKLEGMRISSITTYEPEPKQNFKVLDEEFFISKGFVKTTVDTTKAKEYIDSLPEEVQKAISDKFSLEVTHKQPLIKINNRKAK